MGTMMNSSSSSTPSFFVPFVFQQQKTACPQRARRRSGFTFVEILAVVIIIGVLSAIIVPMFFGKTGQARRAVAASNITDIEAAVQMFYHEHGRLPETLEDLVTRPADIEEGKWNPTLKKKNLTDPWGREYVYQQPGEEGRPFDLVSYGADGQPGGEGEDADVVSW